MTIGRISKLTPKIQKQICEAIRAGSFRGQAANLAGVDRATFFRWMAIGREEETGVHRDFHDAVKAAEDHLEKILHTSWMRAAMRNWVAAAALLERRYPKRWARKNAAALAVNALGGGKDPMRVEIVYSEPAPDDIADRAQSAAVGAPSPSRSR